MFRDDVQCALIFFDITSSSSLDNVSKWDAHLSTLPIPRVICGNKCDSKEPWVQCTYDLENPDVQYFSVVALANYNFEKPFLWLARHLVGNQDLVFVEATAFPPPEVLIHEEEMQRMEKYEDERQLAAPLIKHAAQGS